MNVTAPRPPAGRGLAAALVVAAALLAGGCDSEPPRPVGRLAVTPAEVWLGHGRSATLSAEWTMTAPLVEAGEAGAASPLPRVFVHLLDDAGKVLRTFDHALPFDWRPRETRESAIELWQSVMAPPLPPGEYRLTAGLYEPESGRRWRLETGEGGAPEVDEGEYAVARVRVPPAEPGVEISFEGSWSPAADGADRQVLALRWLRKEGSLVLAGLPPPAARLVLGLRVPEPGDGERWVLDPGADAVRVRVSSSCAARPAVVEGAGGHRVALDLRPPADGRCEVRLVPSFVVLDLGSLATRSVVLERLTVDPSGG